jgi:hypothetical protein
MKEVGADDSESVDVGILCPDREATSSVIEGVSQSSRRNVVGDWVGFVSEQLLHRPTDEFPIVFPHLLHSTVPPLAQFSTILQQTLTPEKRQVLRNT